MNENALDGIRVRLCEIIAGALEKPVDAESIAGHNLVHELGLSSIDALEMLIAIEGEFGIRVDDEDLSLALVSSLSSLEAYVLERIPA